MDVEFFRPIDLSEFGDFDHISESALFNHIKKYTLDEGFPDLGDIQIALIGVPETRGQGQGLDCDLNLLRRQLYALYPGNWKNNIADLGDIMPGESINDTYAALKRQQKQLMARDILPVVLGGSQDLVYAQYRSYPRDKMLNLVNIDKCFDMGDANEQVSSFSYIGKMIVEEPFQLNNYTNIGYQTYYQDQAEIELLEKLFFEAYRLGHFDGRIERAEPFLRDADIATIDLNSISAVHSFSKKAPPNGFTGREICALARYAGLSENLTSFGIFHLQDLDLSENSYMLAAQILWYFIEGYNHRKYETPFVMQPQNYLVYKVPVDGMTLVFYQSKITSRWWVERNSKKDFYNKSKPIALISCERQDYLDACNQIIPERWWKAQEKRI